MKSVLHNFLDSYTSRYSDYHGFWIFGFVVGTMQQSTVDLLDTRSDLAAGTAPETLAVELAIKIFREQMAKARLPLSAIREARLEIRKLPENRNGFVNGTECSGWDVLFKVEATIDSGETYYREKSIFVAPHDARREHRSIRGT